MCLETADISYTETGSELIALLHESSEIKHLYPKFNRAQRKAGEAVGLFSYEDQKGILHLAFNRLKLTPNPIMKFYSMAACRSALEKICERFELCPKYCHLQTNVNACFHYQLQQCRGVCSEKEAIESYNKRVNKAIQSLGLQTENLVIKENGRSDKEIGFVLILNGIYQGFGYIDKNLELSNTEDYLIHVKPQKDNRDIQRILNSYLSKMKKDLKNIIFINLNYKTIQKIELK
jgi:DNA polymerase-3 subunit epsilon